ncbi:hypothetical protein K470DRAFT_258346 [Piedraia hortae CBS 480.64]|uniref:RRM domain-containing protein n=1 Tax=Piedraia hortae CBS 480.64 TaxID=1314780 RepID=A0A6A7BYD2_9PEZI|nr:hypothetical protein K470DRAFT_258346 [Piedraia hortae CBS 480.64]
MTDHLAQRLGDAANNGSHAQVHVPSHSISKGSTGLYPLNTALSTPVSSSILSPTSSARRNAPEPNKRVLYVGGLDPRVTEDVLKQIFETTGPVQSVKIIPDKNFQTKGYSYGFVEYDDPQCAERAMQTLNGRRVHQQEIRVNWAYQATNKAKEDTSNHFHIFVGDLSNEVSDEVLLQAFLPYGTVSEARVMWDMKTGRSRGYAFVSFRERADAERALSEMDGEWLGSRAIRCNWANQKGQPSFTQQQQQHQAIAQMAMGPISPFGQGPHMLPPRTQSYEMVLQQAPQWQTTCYVGNLTPYTTQNDLVPLFQNYGYVIESRFQADRGFAFIKMDTHENAATAICNLHGYNINGRPLKCSWGKDRDGYAPVPTTAAFAPPTAAFFPQYGQPSPMSPQGATGPGALHYPQHHASGSWAPQQLPSHPMHSATASWAGPQQSGATYPMQPQSAGPYTRYPGY